jgi:hypothetical protein
MSLKKIYTSFIANNNILAISNLATSKIFFSGLFLILSLFVFGSIQNIDQANAQPSLGQTIQQFQNNLQSNINKQLQSNLNQGLQSSSSNNNNINCNGSNNFSIQSQTSTNGKTTSTTQSNCNGSVSFNSNSNNLNLKGIIASSEYDKQTGVIINTLYGNWSLTTPNNGITDFKALFTKQPTHVVVTNNVQSGTNAQAVTTNNPTAITNNINSSSSSTNSNIQQDLTTPQPPQQQQNSNVTTYNLSNFRANTLQQQNQDITYVGLIDAVKTVHSNDPTQPDETNDFKDIAVALSILNGRTLVINFYNQSPLFNDFRDIPLVGVTVN